MKKRYRIPSFVLLTIIALLSFGFFSDSLSSSSPSSLMSTYCYTPPFVTTSIPPLVMLVMSKDHKLFLKAYDDVVDLIGNGVPTVTYTDSINYYGYFDSNKCYSYVSGNNRFEAQVLASGANNHYCTGYWSGNFLNWATMARIDIVRAVLYGGRRIIDQTPAQGGLTVLSRTTLTPDSHSWVKVYTGSDIASLTPSSGANNQTAITICNTNNSNT